MTHNDDLEMVSRKAPQVVYLSGKTSTGKSTFARELHEQLGYQVVELDQFVYQVAKAHQLLQAEEAFVEVYRNRKRLDWIKEFVELSRTSIHAHLQNGDKLIVEGAIPHPDTLRELLRDLPGVLLLYFHPSNLAVYERYLTERFMRTTQDYNNGLPVRFWRLIDQGEFRRFCLDRVLTDSLKSAIADYAIQSQKESNQRIKSLSAVGNLEVVQI